VQLVGSEILFHRIGTSSNIKKNKPFNNGISVPVKCAVVLGYKMLTFFLCYSGKVKYVLCILTGNPVVYFKRILCFKRMYRMGEKSLHTDQYTTII